MKEFLNWLGVNERIGKALIYIAIFMVFLIIFNTFLESIGLPFYKITYQNLTKIKTQAVAEYLVSWLTIFLNFYSIVLLVFRVKEIKPILKYAVIYLIINIVLSIFTSNIVLQFFIFIYIVMFSYFYSGKKSKYILYGIYACIFSAIIQFICYSYKVKFIDFEKLNHITANILGIDYFIFIAILIIIKEIYFKKRGAKK